LRWIFFYLFLLASPAFPAAVEEPDPVELGKSAVPFAAYDDKRGWQYGAAGFLYSDREPSLNAGLFIISNLSNFHSVGMTYDQRGVGSWSYGLTLLAERAFDNYYGEGDQTTAQNHVFISQYHFEGRPTLLYRVVPHLRLGAFVDFRSRQENETHYFPDEISASLGLQVQWDTRDKLINTRRGNLFLLNLSKNTGETGFAQVDFDWRHFSRLQRRLIWGSRLVAGASEGQPSYLFRYRLGGLHLLRGYKDNRFRGSEYLVGQEELRWALTPWLSVNVSVDAGGIKDTDYHQLKATGQAGLRLGLPPNWSQKMRVDFGMSLDQMTFQIQFGEIF
jgi:outer membrane protein assembly factor BamA